MGGAKSDLGRKVILMRALQFAGTRHLILRRIRKQLWDNHIVPLFRDYPELRQYFVKDELTLHLPNGSDVVFGYAEHPAHDLQGDIYNWQGSEWATIFVDEAGHFNEEELTFLETRARVIGRSDIIGKLLLTFNPGGRGQSYLARIFIDKRYEEFESPKDYAFIRAFGWDNIEWSRTWLESQGLTEIDYYQKWTDEQRKEVFLTHTPYGRILNRMKGAMRQAYLEGDFKAFVGKFFDIFSLDLHVRHEDIESWHARSIGIDWGYGHNSGVLWGAQVRTDLLSVYREWLGSGRSGKALAQEIVDRTPEEERKHIESIGLSHDAFSKKDERDPINVQMDSVFRLNGMPSCHRAGGDPMGTGTMIYDMLSQETICFDPACPELARVLPEIQRDRKNSKAPAKQEGDDIFEACIAKDSLITTTRGSIPIQNILVGDMVLTRMGWNPVLKLWSLGERPTMRVVTCGEQSLDATPDHRFFTIDKGFIRLDSLTHLDKIVLCKPKSLFGMYIDITGNQEGSIFSVPRKRTEKVGTSYCTALSGKVLMDPSPQSIMSTTKTKTLEIILFQISNVLLQGITQLDILGLIKKKCEKTSMLSGRSLQCGIAQKRAGDFLENTLLNIFASTRVILGKLYAMAVERPLRLMSLKPSIVPILATNGIAAELDITISRESALTAEANSFATGIIPPRIALEVALCKSVTPSCVQSVYDLTVANCHEYFANGILIHNCKHLVEARTGFKPMPADLQVRAHAESIGDPLVKYFYLKKHLGQKPKSVVEVDYAPGWYREGG